MVAAYATLYEMVAVTSEEPAPSTVGKFLREVDKHLPNYTIQIITAVRTSEGRTEQESWQCPINKPTRYIHSLLTQ
jgi:hypothetical protein